VKCQSNVKVSPRVSRAHQAGMGQGIPVSIAMAHKGVMSRG